MHILTMKDKTSSSLGLKIVDWERPMLPEQRDEYMAISGRDGLSHFSRELGNTLLRVRFFKNNYSVKRWLKERNDISEWLYSKEEVVITFDDEPSFYYVGKVTEVDLPEYYKPSVSFWVTFNMHPFKYSDTVEESVNMSNGEGIIDYEGTYEAPYILTIKPSNARDGFTLSMNDVTLTYEGNISTSDTIVIDTVNLEVRINDKLKVLEVEGSFGSLVGGINTLQSNISGNHSIFYQGRSL